MRRHKKVEAWRGELREKGCFYQTTIISEKEALNMRTVLDKGPAIRPERGKDVILSSNLVVATAALRFAAG